jgi:eukaryotic-like serine/threonine-protein kinase
MNLDLLEEIYEQTEQLIDQNHTLMEELETCGARYQNAEQIAEGGMKYVYRCLDIHTDRELIMVKPKSKELNELFVREGRISSFLQHPNIMPVYDVGLSAEGEPFFTMKEVLGEDMDKALEKEYVLANMVDVFIKICEGVNYAHSLGVVHLDLKPANVRIGHFGEVVVCDWGIAELGGELSKEGESFLDKDLNKVLKYIRKGSGEQIKGTLAYIAPERFEKKAPHSSNDIYSLAAILYEILTSEKARQLHSVNDLQVTCPDKLGSSFLPASLVAICNKGLSSNPKDRYPSMLEFLEDLKLYVRGYATAAEKASPVRVLKLLYLRNKGFAHLLIGSITLFILMLIIFIINIEESRQLAIAEKEKAVAARDEIKLLNIDLQEKESARQKLLKLESKRQLMIAYNSLAKKQYKAMNKAFTVAKQFDPQNSGVLYFQGRQELAEREWDDAILSFKQMKHLKAVAFVESIKDLDPMDLLTHMDEMILHLDYPFSEYFLLNLMETELSLEEMVRAYRWCLKVENRGLEHLPQVEVEYVDGGTMISIENERGVKNPGPIHLLKPIAISLKNSGIIYPESLNKCKILESLSLSQTGILGAGNLKIKKLKRLDISQTSSNDSYQFSGMPLLEEINISKTRIKNLRGFEVLENLKVLIIDSSQEKALKNELPQVDYKIK